MQKSCFSFNFRSRILAFVCWPCLCPVILWQWFSVSLILATCINENSPLRKRCPFSLYLFIHLLIALTNPVFCIPWVIMQLCYLFCCLNCSCFGPRELSGEAGSQVTFWGALLSSSPSGAPSGSPPRLYNQSLLQGAQFPAVENGALRWTPERAVCGVLGHQLSLF